MNNNYSESLEKMFNSQREPTTVDGILEKYKHVLAIYIKNKYPKEGLARLLLNKLEEISKKKKKNNNSTLVEENELNILKDYLKSLPKNRTTLSSNLYGTGYAMSAYY